MKDAKGHGSDARGSADISARNLAKQGLRKGAYDGSNSRRFVLFENKGNSLESRSEFTSKGERDAFAAQRLTDKQAAGALAQGGPKSGSVPVHGAFSDVPVGNKFRFASEQDHPFSGMAKGPWVKNSARTYTHAETGGKFRVGSTKAKVLK